MRVTSAFFVSALVRQAQLGGAFALVERRGAAEAGAVFVRVDRLGGQQDLYGPAPQAAFEESRPDSRLFERLLSQVPAQEIDKRLARERDFDPDVWVVVIEDRAGRSFLDVAPWEGGSRQR